MALIYQSTNAKLKLLHTFRLKDSQSPLNPTEKVLFRPLAFIVLNADITFFCHDQLFIKND